MTPTLIPDIEHAILQWTDPHLQTDLLTAGCIRRIQADRDKARIEISLGYPAASYRDEMARNIREQLLLSAPSLRQVDIQIDWSISAHVSHSKAAPMRRVSNLIAIASGKGGVGKSTTAANLALALTAEGAKVGLLDADIYGPSLPMMLGIPADARPDTRDQKYFVPLTAHGVQVMSMGVLVTENTPMVWRGPMASGALQQLLNQTLWEDLDYLIIDMPPGTGDIQLTLSQSAPLTAAAIVTTPQDIALLDAKKGIEAFRKIQVPVLGIIENMSMHVCSQCGHMEHIFGEGGGERIAQEYQTGFLGSLPLDIRIREQSDAGKPYVFSDPHSKIAASYREIARQMAGRLSLLPVSSNIPNVVHIS
ncbi:MAG TPA: iron-sulfur cluster carrier protein ApbC [Pseudomonadales bacterium]|nr:iron-sulfur cluster carrier protein ApbC [Pseudomonadales bacterium]